jgi:hypothetical protein
MLDIHIPIFVAAFTLVTAFLGMHVTLHPAETQQQKVWYKIGFLVCALVGCILVGVQAWRNNHAQGKLQAEIDRIEINTKQPPKVEVNVPPQNSVVQIDPGAIATLITETQRKQRETNSPL